MVAGGIGRVVDPARRRIDDTFATDIAIMVASPEGLLVFGGHNGISIVWPARTVERIFGLDV